MLLRDWREEKENLLVLVHQTMSENDGNLYVAWSAFKYIIIPHLYIQIEKEIQKVPSSSTRITF